MEKRQLERDDLLGKNRTRHQSQDAPDENKRKRLKDMDDSL